MVSKPHPAAEMWGKALFIVINWMPEGGNVSSGSSIFAATTALQRLSYDEGPWQNRCYRTTGVAFKAADPNPIQLQVRGPPLATNFAANLPLRRHACL
jgi:hypothetical protein